MSYLFVDDDHKFKYEKKNTYYCPGCEGRTSHTYVRIINEPFNNSLLLRSLCDSCEHLEIWMKEFDLYYPDGNLYPDIDPTVTFLGESLIYPKEDPVAPTPTIDMPDEVKIIFKESSSVLGLSPRASAALSRLALDMLLPYLGETKGTINDRIGQLVQKGLPIEIQQSLDALRVIGNNAVHPGEMDLKDDRQTAITLLELLNFIVEDRITRPKKIHHLYAKLPPKAIEHIEKRDKK